MNIGIGSLSNMTPTYSSPSLKNFGEPISTKAPSDEGLSLAETFTKSADKPVSLIIQSDDQEKLAALKTQK